MSNDSLVNKIARQRADKAALAHAPIAAGPPRVVGDMFMVPTEPLDTRRKGAQRKLGLQPAGVVRGDAINPSALVPATYRPLAGLSPNQRGQTVLVDSALIGQNTSVNPQGYTERTTVAQARSPGDDAEAICVTLGFQLSHPIQQDLVTLFDTRVRCLLTWGIGGAEYTALLDWLNGSVIAVCANFVRVEVIVPDNSAVLPQRPPAFMLSAAFGYGVPTQHRDRARLTVPLGTITNGAESTPVEIPDFAIGMSLSTKLGTGPYRVVQHDLAPFVLLQFKRTYNWTGASAPQDQSAGAIPVVNGANFVTIANLSGGDDDVDLVFDLAL